MEYRKHAGHLNDWHFHPHCPDWPLDEYSCAAFLPGQGVIGWWLGGTLCRSGNDFTAQLGVGRQNAMEVNQMETRARHQSRQALHELKAP